MAVLTPINQNLQALPVIRLGATQPLAVAGASAVTPDPVGGEIVRIVVTVAMHIAFGDAPSATTDDAPLLPGETHLLSCRPSDKVALIKAAGEPDGSAWITTAEGA